MRAVEAARAAYGLCQLLAPEWLAERVVGVRLDRRARLVVRVLGARHVVQAVVTTRADDRRARPVAAGLDTVHAASMVALAVVDRRRRGIAVADAMIAATFAVEELLATTRRPPDGRDDPPERDPATAELFGIVDPEVEDYRRHRRRAALQQQVIRDVLERCRGQEVEAIMAELSRANAAHGLPAQPGTWLRGVATDLAAGHLYVVSVEALRDTETRSGSDDVRPHDR